MNVWAWALLATMALESLIMVGRVGKPRKPLSAGDAVAGVIQWGLMAFMLVMAVIS